VLRLHDGDVVDPLPPDKVNRLILPSSFDDERQAMGS